MPSFVDEEKQQLAALAGERGVAQGRQIRACA
jgi:hypothetical protein